MTDDQRRRAEKAMDDLCDELDAGYDRNRQARGVDEDAPPPEHFLQLAVDPDYK